MKSLRSWIRLLLIGLAGFCVVATGVTLIVLAFRAQMQQTKTLQLERSRAAAAEIDLYVEDLQRKMGYLARVDGLATAPVGVQQALIDALVRHNNAYEAVWLLDRTGHVVASAFAETPIEPEDVAESAGFKRALDHGEDYLGPVEVDPALGVPVLTLGVPIRGTRDAVAGVLMARVNLKFLGFLVSRIHVGETGHAYVVDSRDRLVAKKNEPARLELTDLSRSSVIHRMHTEPSGDLGTYRGLEGVRVIGAFSPIASAGWYAVVELPTDEALAPVRHMVEVMAAALAGATLIAVGIGVLFSRRLVVPLRRMTQAAQQLQAGNLDAQVIVSSDDELGLLATTFNKMSAELKRLISSLQASLDEIQQAEHRATFLSEASALLSESLDSQIVLGRVAQLAVTSFADWCVIDLIDPTGQIHRAAAAHAEPAKVPLLHLRPLHEQGSLQPVEGVLESEQPLLVPDVTDSALDALGRAEDRRLVRTLDTRSVMVVPLRLQARTIGTVTFGSSRPERHYGRAELTLAEDLGHRAALAIDNARLYMQAQEAIRARETFIAVASHELRTPLTPLKLHLQNLLRALSDATVPVPRERLVRLVGTAERQTTRLDHLVTELLDVSRIASGRFRLAREDFDLSEVVAEVTTRLAPQAERAGSSLTVEVGGLANGSWDRLRIEQVITNLISNAIKFGAQRPIEVDLDVQPSIVRLRVRDHGIGISKADQARIFERFERAVSDMHYGGLGLGLFISQQIVAAHGGTIFVESVPGEGSTFTVELPRQPPASPEDPSDGS